VKKEEKEKKVREKAAEFLKRAKRDNRGSRHDRIRPDEIREMKLARRVLKWSDNHIAGIFDRDRRQVRKVLEAPEKPKRGATLKASDQVTIQPEKGLQFEIDLKYNEVWINSLTVRPTDCNVAFDFYVFDKKQKTDFQDEVDIVTEVSSKGGRIHCEPIYYQDQDECRHLHCGIGLHKKRIRFDLDDLELNDYMQKPVTFEVTIIYTLAP